MKHVKQISAVKNAKAAESIGDFFDSVWSEIESVFKKDED